MGAAAIAAGDPRVSPGIKFGCRWKAAGPLRGPLREFIIGATAVGAGRGALAGAMAAYVVKKFGGVLMCWGVAVARWPPRILPRTDVPPVATLLPTVPVLAGVGPTK